MITIIDRLRVASALDRIIYDDPSLFQAADARLVFDLIPRGNPPKPIRLEAMWTSSGKSMDGYSPGVGNIQMGGDDEAKEISFGGGTVFRAGQWKTSWQNNSLRIWKMMDDDIDPENQARLYFDGTGKPVELKGAVMKSIKIPFIPVSIGRVTWHHWKKPSELKAA